MGTILDLWCDICVHLQAWAILGGGLIVWYTFHTERRDMREARHQTPTPDLFPGVGKKGVRQTDTLSGGSNKKGLHSAQHHVGGSDKKAAALVRVEPVKGVGSSDTLHDAGRWAA